MVTAMKRSAFILIATLCWTWGAQAQGDPWADSYRYEAEGQYQPALSALEPLLNRRPVNEMALLRHGWLNYLLGHHERAAEDYGRALSLNPKSIDARLGLTLPLMAQGRWREAAVHAGQVLEVAPWQYYGHVRLMACEEALGQWETLAKHAEAVALRYPSDATLWVYLARARAALGNGEAARAAYAKVLERYPGHLEAVNFIHGPGG